MEKIKAELRVDEPARRRIRRLRNEVFSLEGTVILSEDKTKMDEALARLLGSAKRLKGKISSLERNIKKNGKNPDLQSELAELRECFDAYHIALEQVAQRCADSEIRNLAFDFIQSNSIAVKLIYQLTQFPDIKQRAKELSPTRPDRYYKDIVAPLAAEDKFKGICISILAHLQSKTMNESVRKEMMQDAKALIKAGNVKWGNVQTVIRDLKDAINEKREEKGVKPIGQKQLAASVQAYLDGEKGSFVEELKDALTKIRKMREKTD
jgi:hypothetical protein